MALLRSPEYLASSTDPLSFHYIYKETNDPPPPGVANFKHRAII